MEYPEEMKKVGMGFSDNDFGKVRGSSSLIPLNELDSWSV
jgi:hypothetical protein